jgi:AraC-like DNA-binding protein
LIRCIPKRLDHFLRQDVADAAIPILEQLFAGLEVNCVCHKYPSVVRTIIYRISKKIRIVWTIKNMSGTIMPKSASHLLVPMKFAGCSPLRSRGVLLAGISRLSGSSAPLRLNTDHHKILYTIRGQGVLTCDGGPHRLVKDALWVIPSSVKYSLRARGGKWEVMWFYLRPGVPWRHLSDQPPHQRFRGQSQRMVHVMTGLIGEVTSPCEDRIQMGKLFAEALGMYLDRRLHNYGDATSNNLRHLLAQLWEEVDANLSAPWSVNDFAARLHLSTPHAHRIIRQFHKASPVSVLIGLRLRRATELLSHTDLKLDAIAEMVGYQSGFALSKAFRRELRVSPRVYRKRRLSVTPPRR